MDIGNIEFILTLQLVSRKNNDLSEGTHANEMRRFSHILMDAFALGPIPHIIKLNSLKDMSRSARKFIESLQMLSHVHVGMWLCFTW